jgi:hypothetical protein
MKAQSFWVCQGGDHRSPWEVEMRDWHKQTEISVVETIGGHGRWSLDEGTEFLSKLTIHNWSFAKIYYSCPMRGGGVVEMVEMYLQNKYTKTRKFRFISLCPIQLFMSNMCFLKIFVYVDSITSYTACNCPLFWGFVYLSFPFFTCWVTYFSPSLVSSLIVYESKPDASNQKQI